jgi:membrane protein required for colicin V production
MLDFVTAIVVALGFFRGFRKGLIVAVFSFVAVLLGVLIALKLSHLLSAWLVEKGVGGTWAPMAAYVLLFVGVGFAVRAGARAIEGLSKAVMLGLINKLAGGLLYAFIGAVVWSSLLWLAARIGLVSPETKTNSKTYAYLEPLAPAVFDKAGVVLPFARDVFSDLSSTLDSASHHQAAPGATAHPVN